MAAVTPTVKRYKTNRAGETLIVYYGTSAANQADTMTTTVVGSGKRQQLLYANATYSGSPTQAGVTTTIDSGFGSGYDTIINTGSANAKHSSYQPSAMHIGDGDAWVVSVPAGGSSQTVGMVVAVLET